MSNIIFVLPGGFVLGGVTTWAVGLCRRLSQAGHPVGLIRHLDVEPTVNVNLPPTVKQVWSKKQSILHDFYTESDLLSFQTDYQQLLPGTLVLSGVAGTFAISALIARQNPALLRVIALAHADEPDYYDWLTYYEPLVHKFVAVSDEIATKLKSLISDRTQNICVRPYAIEFKDSLERTYTSHPHPLQLMYAGRIIEQQKRVSDLLRLAAELEANQVNFQLRLIGDGPDLPGIIRQLSHSGKKVRSRVMVTKHLPPDHMGQTWQSADICLLVSDYEGTSVSMLEAMAAGCVPVVSQVSGVAGVIRPGVNGFTVPIGDMAEMARCIKMLDDDRQLLAQLGRAAHATVQNSYSYEQYIPWFLNLVDEAWRMPPRPWPEGRPLHRYPTLKERIDDLSGEQLSRLASTRQLIKALGFKAAGHPALKWLYRWRGVGKKLVGG